MPAGAVVVLDGNNGESRTTKRPRREEEGDDDERAEARKAANDNEGDAMETSVDNEENAAESSPASPSPPLLSPEKIRRLRLEAIFHPKFENEKKRTASRTAGDDDDDGVRRQMKDRVRARRGYLEASLKHSGSLLLWSGDDGRFYSKNSMDNRFAMTGELLLRQHFVRAYWNEREQRQQQQRVEPIESRYEECGRYVRSHRLTLAFEIVASKVLGDHGQRPRRDFLVLTAVACRGPPPATTRNSDNADGNGGVGKADRTLNRPRERFYTTEELVRFAQKFRLPHNDCFAFTSPQSADRLFELYDASKAEGTASTVVPALQRCADAHVTSMYQHEQFQGDLLEGLVIRYVPYQNQRQPMGEDEESNNDNLTTMRELSTRSLEIWNETKDLPDCHELVRLSSSSMQSSSYPPALATKVRELVDPNVAAAFDENEFAVEYERKLRDVLRRSGPRRSLSRGLLEVTNGEGRPELTRREEGDCETTAIEAAATDAAYADSSVKVTASALPLQELLNSNDRETRRIASVVQTLRDMGRAVNYSLYRERHGEKERWLLVINVLHDTTFQKFEATRKLGDMKLFRGFVVELVLNGDDDDDDDEMRTTTDRDAPIRFQDLVADSDNNEEDQRLMLKMKFLPYMVRTFGVRNGLSGLARHGPDAFLKYVRDLFNRWQMPQEAYSTWQPFFVAWASYAANVIQSQQNPENGVKAAAGDTLLPPLSSTWYLDHLEYFERLYREGHVHQLINLRETSNFTFSGLVVVVAQDDGTSAGVADVIKEKVSAKCVSPLKKITPEKLLISCDKGQGIVATTTVEGGLGPVKKLLREKPEAISLVLVGCSEEELSHERDFDDERKRRKIIGMADALLKSKCASVFTLPRPPLTNGVSPELLSGDDFDAMVVRLREISDSLQRIDTRIGLLVFFPGMPGCGKSTLVESSSSALRQQIESICPEGAVPRKVIVQTGDKVSQKYWRLVTKEKLIDRSSVYIADKNAPATAWFDIGSVAAKTKSLAVPIVSGLETTRIKGVRALGGELRQTQSEQVFPFSLRYLAVCISRILDRPAGTHHGKLDDGTQRACFVVVKFFWLYRGLTAESFNEVLKHKIFQAGAVCISTGVEVPFFSDVPEGLPEDLEAVLIEAIQAHVSGRRECYLFDCPNQSLLTNSTVYFFCSTQAGYDSKKLDPTTKEDKYLEDLECRIRAAIRRHRDVLASMTVEEGVSCKRFVSQLTEVVCQADSLESYELPEATNQSSFVKLVALDVPADSITNALRNYSGVERFKGFWEAILGVGKSPEEFPDHIRSAKGKFVSNTHVTMAHFRNMKQEQMKAMFQPLSGSRVKVSVAALLYSERVAALEVSVADMDENNAEVPRPQNGFAHVTIWHSVEASPVESNDLPSQLESRKAHRIPFDEKIDFTGVISMWKSDYA